MHIRTHWTNASVSRHHSKLIIQNCWGWSQDIGHFLFFICFFQFLLILQDPAQIVTIFLIFLCMSTRLLILKSESTSIWYKPHGSQEARRRGIIVGVFSLELYFFPKTQIIYLEHGDNKPILPIFLSHLKEWDYCT